MRVWYKFISLALVVASFLGNFGNVQAQTQKLIQSSDLEYLGAFRLPRGENGHPNGFSYGGGPIAYNKNNNSLFVTTRHSGIAEVSIPSLVKSSNIEELPFANTLEEINTDPTEGGLAALPDSSIRGLLVKGEKIFGTVFVYYDASNSARVSHFSRPLDLSKKGATPFKPLWQAEKSGFVSGWLAEVPTEWQSALGGDVISGNCCVPIVSRTSFGPSAFSWKTSDFEGSGLVPAVPLLYYPGDHPTLGDWGDSNPIYGGTTQIGGMVIPKGTSSLLYFGLNGTGKFCYGTGGLDGECPNPLSSSKGSHAYPYNHQVWAFDLNDLAEVKKGNKNPWDVKPYSVWQIEFPNSFMSTYGLGGVAYDSEKKLIYVSQLQADTDGYSSRALIHVFKVNAGTAVSKTNTSSSAPDRTSSTIGSISGSVSNKPKLTPAPSQIQPVTPLINRNLFMGIRGADVVTLQNYLIQKGYLKVNATGYFGPLTRAAVQGFQRDKGLPRTGFFGPLSRAAIG